MRIYYKTAHHRVFESLREPKDGCWIHFECATPQDSDELCRLTGLDATDVQDCFDKYELPRLEKIKHNLLLFIKQPCDEEVGLYTATFTIILTPRYFITVSTHKSPFIDSYIAQKTNLSTMQKGKLLIGLLLRMAHDFTLQIKKVRHTVLNQEKALTNVTSEDIIALTKNEDILNQYLSALVPMRNVLEGITSGKYLQLHEKEYELLEDLQNASKQSEMLCSVNLKSIRSLRTSFQIIFTNNVTRTIKLLTALTIIFSIPTVIASIYGMNVSLPFASSPFAFAYLMAAIAVFFVLAWFYFQRKRWL